MSLFPIDDILVSTCTEFTLADFASLRSVDRTSCNQVDQLVANCKETIAKSLCTFTLLQSKFLHAPEACYTIVHMNSNIEFSMNCFKYVGSCYTGPIYLKYTWRDMITIWVQNGLAQHAAMTSGPRLANLHVYSLANPADMYDCINAIMDYVVSWEEPLLGAHNNEKLAAAIKSEFRNRDGYIRQIMNSVELHKILADK